MSRKLTLMFALGIVACGPKPATTTPDPTTDTSDGDGGGEPSSTEEPAGMTCTSMGDALEATIESKGEYGTSQIRQARAILIDECEEHAWSEDVIQCIAAAASAAGMASCEDTMPDDQKASLQQQSLESMLGE